VPELKQAIKVEVSQDVQEKVVSNKIADYLAKLRAKGFGGGAATQALA
jgi:ribosomal protein S17E